MKPPYKASSSMDVLLAPADTLLLCVKVRLGTYNVANPCHQICLFRVLGGGSGSALSGKNSDVSFVGLQCLISYTYFDGWWLFVRVNKS